MFSLKKVKISEIWADEDNPRDIGGPADELLTLSLMKFGLLSPLYVFPNGMLVSGHQRSRILKHVFKKDWIPCCYIKHINTNKKNSANWLFNREMQEQGKNVDIDITKDQNRVIQKIKDLPDVKDPYKSLLGMEFVDCSSLEHKNVPDESDVKMSGFLHRWMQQVIPIIADNNNTVINGSSRLEYYKTKVKKVPVVRVSEDVGEVFRYATASYDIDKAKDNIRQSAARNIVKYYQSSFCPMTKIVYGAKVYNAGPDARAENLKSNYKRILDFGSGNGKQNVEMIERGVNITQFEPFATKDIIGKVSIRESYENIEKFLIDFEENGFFDLVTAHAVINSVPYKEDQEKVCLLLAFLAKKAKILALSFREQVHVNGEYFKTGSMNYIEGEKKIMSSGYRTKVQTAHTLEEVEDMIGMKSSKQLRENNYMTARFEEPRIHISKKALLEAVRFEFNLSYFGRNFNSLAKKAEEVFMKHY